MSGTGLRPDLGSAVAAFAAGELAAAELQRLFLDRTVYALRRAEPPGLVAVGQPGTGAIPVFSSLEQLARWCVGRGEANKGADWLACPGADLLALWPPGYDLVLDPGSDHPVGYPAELMRRETAVVGRRRERAGGA